MKKSAKKVAGFDGNQNQREVVQMAQPCNTNDYITDVMGLQGAIPIFTMADETAESWNAKAKRINREAALHRAWEYEHVGVDGLCWREYLTAEEAELVAAWDEQYVVNVRHVGREILMMEVGA